MEFVEIFLLVLSLGFIFVSYLSTSSKKRFLFFGIGFGLFMLVGGIEMFYFRHGYIEPKFDISDYFIIFMSCMFFSQFIANIVNQNRIEAPVVFVKRRGRFFEAGLGFVLFIVASLYLLLMFNSNFSDGAFVVEIADLSFLIVLTFVFFLLLIFIIIYPFQRTAFCEDGLFYNTFFYDWLSFESYSWKKNQLILDENWGNGTVKIWIPDEKRQEVEAFMVSNQR